MATKKNTRCPLQQECEKKCEFEGHELECSYYSANAIEGKTIPDQEEIRRRNEAEKDLADYEADRKRQRGNERGMHARHAPGLQQLSPAHPTHVNRREQELGDLRHRGGGEGGHEPGMPDDLQHVQMMQGSRSNRHDSIISAQGTNGKAPSTQTGQAKPAAPAAGR